VGLLEAILLDRAAGADACVEMRQVLSRQFYLDQLPRFLPANQYAAELGEKPLLAVRNKTGFSVGIRGDVASLGFPGRRPLVVAAISNWPQADAARRSLLQEPASILHGTLARLAVDALRPGLVRSAFLPYSGRAL